MRTRFPSLGSSREPVRFHLWAAMGVAALAAVGVERLVRSPGVSLRPGLIVAVLARRALDPDRPLCLRSGLDSS